MDEDKIAIIHGKEFVFATPQAMDPGDDELAIFGLVIEVCYLAVRDQTDASGFEPSLQGSNQGIVLVEDGSLDAREGFNAGNSSMNRCR